MRYKIQIIEDERELSDGIQVFLTHQNYDTQQSFSGKEAIKDFETFRPHIILLDTLLPDIRGTELCKAFKKDRSVGIIFLTALSSKKNIVEGFKCGADDYIQKPYDLDILLARIEALTNRINFSENELDESIALLFDIYKNDISYKGNFVGLTQTEFRILHYLYSHQGFLTSESILQHLYETAYSGIPSRTISVHIAKIRRKLADKGITDIEIKSKYKKGYMLINHNNGHSGSL